LAVVTAPRAARAECGMHGPTGLAEVTHLQGKTSVHPGICGSRLSA